LVTGAYGLLGTWLVRELLDQDVEVTVLRRDVSRSALVADGLETRVNVVAGDVTSFGVLDRVIGDYEVDSVFHLAAQTIVGAAHRSPLETWETNVRGTWIVMEACRRHEVARVVVAASDKAYGRHEELPYRESFALDPHYPYDVSKAAADLIARSYFHTYGIPVATTRFANLYGGGDANRSRLIPEVVAAALDGRAPVLRSDGSPVRDYLYVEDAARAYVALAEALDGEGARGEAFNAGSGTPHSVAEVVALVCALTGIDVAPQVAGDGVPPGEIDVQLVDATKLRELTGWSPAVSLEEGLQRTIEWYRAHPSFLASH
jgi:CDP-glucose 4,6-dehydratase